MCRRINDLLCIKSTRQWLNERINHWAVISSLWRGFQIQIEFFLCKSIPRDSEIGDTCVLNFFFSVYTIEKRNIITSTIEKEERFRTVPGGVLFSPPLRRIYWKMYFQKALREWFWIEPRLKRFSGFYYGRSL